MELNTFSITARCKKTGRLGVAVLTKAFGVGFLCPFVKAGVGAISTQAWVNTSLGHRGLSLLQEGKGAEEVLKELIESDPGKEMRQLAIVDRKGGVAGFTGSKTNDWKGHIIGDQFVCAGNLLVGEAVLKAMSDSFNITTNEELGERLLKSVEAGQEAGGDNRGKQSAALIVEDHQEFPYINLRVDDHETPDIELRRLFEIHKQGLLKVYDQWIDTIKSGQDPSGDFK
ncbi:DUF1028 domain-containing protein [Paenisporosarcina sp. TG20]|uniref:DUF1028 domain-containing protein n=1 Tax=Paenisporosarcina sp. TG20 TaxID=1211706 RepID=UPI0003103954|nr:DUF1028 domain-containing protein [Paenisporosarcina sp. TG20]